MKTENQWVLHTSVDIPDICSLFKQVPFFSRQDRELDAKGLLVNFMCSDVSSILSNYLMQSTSLHPQSMHTDATGNTGALQFGKNAAGRDLVCVMEFKKIADQLFRIERIFLWDDAFGK